MTLSSVIVDCSLVEQPGMLGVALGRVRSTHDVELINFSPQSVRKHRIDINRVQCNHHLFDVQPVAQCLCSRVPVYPEEQDVEMEVNMNRNNETDDDLPTFDDADDDVLVQHVNFIEHMAHDLGNEEVNNNDVATTTSTTLNNVLPDDFSLSDCLELMKYSVVRTEKQQMANQICDLQKTNTRFADFCKECYTMMIQKHRTCIRKIPCEASHLTAYHMWLSSMYLSDEHQARIVKVNGGPNPEPLLKDLLWRVLQRLSSVIETVRQDEEEVVSLSAFTSARTSTSSFVRGKIRYIAGYVVFAEQKELMRKMRTSSESMDLNVLLKYDVYHDCLLALRTLIRSQEEVEKETEDLESL